MRITDTDGAAEKTLLELLPLVGRDDRRKIIEKWAATEKEVDVLRWWLTVVTGKDEANKTWLYQAMRKYRADPAWDNARKLPEIRWEMQARRHHKGYVDDKPRFRIEPHRVFDSVLELYDRGKLIEEVEDTAEGKMIARRILRDELNERK